MANIVKIDKLSMDLLDKSLWINILFWGLGFEFQIPGYESI
jgi:hypothetical protein